MAKLLIEDEKEIETELILFDKDGTLITHHHYIPIMKKRAQILSQSLKLSQEVEKGLIELMGVDIDRDIVIPQGSIYSPRRDVFREVIQFLGIEGVKPKVAGEAARMAFKDADKEVKLEEHVRAIEGTLQLFQVLKSKGVKIAVCTHDTSHSAKRHLKAVNLASYVDLFVGLDPGSKLRAKPAPDMLQFACKNLKILSTKAIMIGDTDLDMQAGKGAAVASCIGVLSGQSGREELFSADYILESIGKLNVK